MLKAAIARIGAEIARREEEIRCLQQAKAILLADTEKQQDSAMEEEDPFAGFDDEDEWDM